MTGFGRRPADQSLDWSGGKGWRQAARAAADIVPAATIACAELAERSLPVRSEFFVWLESCMAGNGCCLSCQKGEQEMSRRLMQAKAADDTVLLGIGIIVAVAVVSLFFGSVLMYLIGLLS